MDHTLYYLQEFKKYISLQTASPNTIKNYLSDLRLFFFFITTNQHLVLDPSRLPSYINEEFINRYNEFLSVTNPPATAKRRISSLKKFIDYCATQSIYPVTDSPTVTAAPVVSDYTDPLSFSLPSYPAVPQEVVPPLVQDSPVIPETPTTPAISVGTLPDPENLVHNFLDLKPVVPVTSSPAPASNTYLPVLVSIASFLISFGLTLLIHIFFFQ